MNQELKNENDSKNLPIRIPQSSDFNQWKFLALNRFTNYHLFGQQFSQDILTQQKCLKKNSNQKNQENPECRNQNQIDRDSIGFNKLENQEIKIAKVFLNNNDLQVDYFYSPKIFDEIVQLTRNFTNLLFKFNTNQNQSQSICQFLSYEDTKYIYSETFRSRKMQQEKISKESNEPIQGEQVHYQEMLNRQYFKQRNNDISKEKLAQSRFFQQKILKNCKTCSERINIDFFKSDHCKFTIKLPQPKTKKLALVDGFIKNSSDDSTIKFALMSLHDSYESIGNSGSLFMSKSKFQIGLKQLAQMFFMDKYDRQKLEMPLQVEITLLFQQCVNEAYITVIDDNQSINQNYTKSSKDFGINLLITRNNFEKTFFNIEISANILQFHSNQTPFVEIHLNNVKNEFMNSWINVEMTEINGFDSSKDTYIFDNYDNLSHFHRMDEEDFKNIMDKV